MSDVFDLVPSISIREQLIKQFGEWWDDEEIRTEIIPNIVGKNMRDSINGALKNYSNEKTHNVKSFAEILYDLVGQNFLVNKDKSIKLNFLRLILCKKMADDSMFYDRFLHILEKTNACTAPAFCKRCGVRWSADSQTYMQILGLETPIECSSYDCFTAQQREAVPDPAGPAFESFIQNFAGRDYRRFCKSILMEFDFPREVMFRPASEIKLLPEVIRPMGKVLQLYDYQASIGLKIRDMLEKYAPETSRALVVLPTGAGKTRLVVETLIEWINNGKRGKKDSKFVVWMVDRNELCQQAFDTFAETFRHRGRRDSSLKLHPIYGDNPKNIGDILYQYSNYDDDDDDDEDEDGHTELNEENGVIIASIQSLYSLSQNADKGNLPELGRYTSAVIIDEAHHAVPSNKSYGAVLRALGFNFRGIRSGKGVNKHKTCLIGLTATPFRGDAEGDETSSLLRRFGGIERILWPPFSDFVRKRENIPPYAHLYVQSTAYLDESIKLYGEDSYDRDGKIFDYRFVIEKIDDDNANKNITVFDKTSSESNIDYIFKNVGRYNVSLIVRDDEGMDSRNSTDIVVDVLSIENRIEQSNSNAMRDLYKHLIKREILSKPHHYIINSKLKFSLEGEEEYFKRFHDISNRKVQEIGNDPHRNNKIIEKIDSLINKEGRRSILFFACSVEHSKLISFILDAIHGIRSASVDHTTSPEERSEIIHDFRTGAISVLCNYGILSTGFDSPKVDCVFVSRPTFSYLLYNQMTGRGLRGPRSGGTPDCVIVDISDNIQLVSDNTNVIQQPWMMFEYIYETIYDERELHTEQTCFGCFGTGSKNLNAKNHSCKICNGAGMYPLRKAKPDSPVQKIDVIKELQDMQRKYPKDTLEQLRTRIRKKRRYDDAFGK